VKPFRSVRSHFKGAPQILAGLLVLLPLAAHAAFAQEFTFDSGGGILLHWKGEQIAYWDGGFSYKNKNFENGFNFLQIKSDLAKASGEILKFGYSAKYDFAKIHPEFSAGYIELSQTDVYAGTKKITSGGGEGFYIGASAGFDVRDFVVTPSVLFAKGKFKDGDFNFFYGKPDIPKILHLGLSGEYDRRHKISFTFTGFELDILGNDSADMGNPSLFDAEGSVFGGGYKYSRYGDEDDDEEAARANDGTALPRFSAAAGLHRADLSARGSLTAANQKYFLFPFEFYDIDGREDATIGHAVFDINFKRTRLQQSLKFGAVHVIGGNAVADIHSKRRKFFGKDEDFDTKSMDLQNTGLGFVSYAVEAPRWKITEKIHLDFKVRKTLACPWGIRKFAGGKDGEKKKGFFDDIAKTKTDLVKAVLLSGLTWDIKIGF